MEDDSGLSFHRRPKMASSSAFGNQKTAFSHHLHQTQPAHLLFHATAAAPPQSRNTCYQYQPIVQDKSFLRAEAEQYLAEILMSRATDTVQNCYPTTTYQNILSPSPPPDPPATPETRPTENNNNLESQTLPSPEPTISIPVPSPPPQNTSTVATTSTSTSDINAVRSDVNAEPDLMQDIVYSDVSSDGCLNEIFDINSSDEETDFKKGNHEIRIEDVEMKIEPDDESDSSVAIVKQMVSVGTQTEQQLPENLKIRSIVELDTAINNLRHESFSIREQLDHISHQNAHQNAQDWQNLDFQQTILEEIKLMGEQNKLGMESINSNIKALRQQIEDLNNIALKLGLASGLTEAQNIHPSLLEEEQSMNVVHMDNIVNSSTTNNAPSTSGNISTLVVTPTSSDRPPSNSMSSTTSSTMSVDLARPCVPFDVCYSTQIEGKSTKFADFKMKKGKFRDKH